MNNLTTNPADLLSSRFQGRLGKTHLAEKICEQFIVNGNKNLAKKLAKKAKLLDVKKGSILINQGAADNDLYLIISGCFEILVNERITATRSTGMHLGEMAILDNASKRSSTVKAKEESLVARIQNKDFIEIAKKSNTVWRRLATELANRLKERNKFHDPPHSQPVIFIGSTTEALPVAKLIYNKIKTGKFVAKLWENDVFNPGATTIEDLVNTVNDADFGVMVLTPDDKLISRKKKHQAPRDNIIFEIGLLIGSIGRERTFLVSTQGVNLKIPTDLLGVNRMFFKFNPRDKKYDENDVLKVIKDIKKTIKIIGPK